MDEKPPDEGQKKHQHFADTVRAAMAKNKLNASDVARRIWGVSKDRRGYDVAKNRDRIGAYLSGNSYPDRENLAKLADALGVAVEDLGPRGLGGKAPSPEGTAGPSELRMTFEVNGKVHVRGHINVLIEDEQFQELYKLIRPR